ncbi:MAG TPA: helix-turn-helix transcriptional regulator [Pseudonocardiaceae bacterium]|jgi:transcriptional regulator with XRE-family HTH domain
METVATRRHIPTVRLRRLAAELRRLRAGSGLSRESVSEQTGINVVTLYRIETARTKPQLRTLNALLLTYQTSADVRSYLTTLCRDAGRQGWLRPYHSDLPEVYRAYVSFEDEASAVCNYESLFVPGLLQTEDYARAVIRGVVTMATPHQVDNWVQARIERQQVLAKDAPLKFWAVVDEACLHRQVGGAAIMRGQLRALVEAAGNPTVTIQVIPFSSGAHPGMPGSFALMSFPDPMDMDIIYIDSMAGDLFLESDAEISRYTSMFDTLRAVALSPDHSRELISRLASSKEE